MWSSAIASSTMRRDKLAVFQEVMRCLRPGGRLVLTDLVAEGAFSQAALADEVWGEWLGVAIGKAGVPAQHREGRIQESRGRSGRRSFRWQNRMSG